MLSDGEGDCCIHAATRTACQARLLWAFERVTICQWYSKSAFQLFDAWSICEILRSRAESERDSAPAWHEPGAVLDADRRHAERWFTLRKRARDAAAGEGVAAARARRADRFVASQARRLRDHQLSEGAAPGSLSEPSSRGAQSQRGTGHGGILRSRVACGSRFRAGDRIARDSERRSAQRLTALSRALHSAFRRTRSTAIASRHS